MALSSLQDQSGIHPVLRRSSYLGLIGLVLATLALRFYVIRSLPRVVRWDEAQYLLIGQNLFRGYGLTPALRPDTHWAPLYPIVSHFLFLLTGNLERASDAAWVLFGALLLFPTFFLARRVYCAQTAWLAAALVAIFPALATSSVYWTMTEPLNLLLLYTGLACLLKGLEEQHSRHFAMAGALFGLAYLTRPEGISYFMVFLIFSFCWLVVLPQPYYNTQPVGYRQRLGKALLPLAAFTVLFAVVAMPYVSYLHRVSGRWMVSGKPGLWNTQAAALAQDWKTFDRLERGLDNSGQETMWYSPQRFEMSLLRIFLTQPRVIAHFVLANMAQFDHQFFISTMFWHWLLPLPILGLFAHPWSFQRLKRELFLMAAVVPCFSFLPFHYLERYLAPLFPILLIWTAHGALQLGKWLEATLGECLRPPAILRWLPAVCVVVFFVAMMPRAARVDLWELDFGDKEAGLWLRDHTPLDSRIFSRDAGVAVYAQRRWIPSPHAEWTDFLRYGVSRGAGYFVVNSSELTYMRPELLFVLKSPPPELQLVFRFERNAQETLVYKIRGAAQTGN